MSGIYFIYFFGPLSFLGQCHDFAREIAASIREFVGHGENYFRSTRIWIGEVEGQGGIHTGNILITFGLTFVGAMRQLFQSAPNDRRQFERKKKTEFLSLMDDDSPIEKKYISFPA